MAAKEVRWLLSLLTVVLGLHASPLLWAGGWNNNLIGCRAIAMGGAFVGLADEPSAIYYNPAGIIVQGKRLNLSIEGFYVWPTYVYTPPSGSAIKSRYSNPLPQFCLTYQASSRLAFGFGVYVPYAGSGVDWKTEDIGFPLKSSLGVFSLTPTVACKLNEKLSLGLNLNIYYAVSDLTTLYTIGAFENNSLKAEESGSAVSATVGLLFRPSERLGFGLTVRGPAEIRMKGLTSLSLAPQVFELDSETVVKLPWDIEAGVSWRAAERLTFTADAQYTFWSTLDKVKKTIFDVPFIGDLCLDETMDFKNILILRAGAEYMLPRDIFLRAGIGYDRAAAPVSTLSIANIDVDKFVLVGGLGIRRGKIRIDLATVYAMGKEREKTFPLPVIPPLIEKYNLNVLILGAGITFSY